MPHQLALEEKQLSVLNGESGALCGHENAKLFSKSTKDRRRADTG